MLTPTDSLYLLYSKIKVGDLNLLLAELVKFAIDFLMRKDLVMLQMKLMFEDIYFQQNLASKFKPNIYVILY